MLVIYPDSAQGFLVQYPDAFAKEVAAFLVEGIARKREELVRIPPAPDR